MESKRPRERQLEEYFRRLRVADWGCGVGIAAMLVAAFAAAVLGSSRRPAYDVAVGLFVVAAIIAAAAGLVTVVGNAWADRAAKDFEPTDATALIKKKRWPEAIAALQPRLSSTDPDEVIDATNLLADIYAMTDRNAEAEAMIRRVIELVRADDSEEPVPIQLICLGVVLRREGKLEEAEEIFAQALDDSRRAGEPEATVFALRNVAYLYWTMGQSDRARNIYDNMPECDPDRLEFLSEVLRPYEEPALPEVSR
jgi:tetratricopeptide (TPR) repeat protein